MTSYRQFGFPGIPPVVKNLIIINAIVFLLQSLAPRYNLPLDDYFALHYWGSPLFRWWQLVTHMFMHGSFTHILFNMFALFMFGRIVEDLWGPKRFLIFYFVCGIGAALCHLTVLTIEYAPLHNAVMNYQAHPGYNEFVLFAQQHHININPNFLADWAANPTSVDFSNLSKAFASKFYLNNINEATLGASGAIFGLLFAVGYLFPNSEVIIIPIPFPIKMKWAVTGYALLELSQGLYNSAGDNIAHFAHLGGMLFAFIMLRIWRNKIHNRHY